MIPPELTFSRADKIFTDSITAPPPKAPWPETSKSPVRATSSPEAGKEIDPLPAEDRVTAQVPVKMGEETEVLKAAVVPPVIAPPVIEMVPVVRVFPWIVPEAVIEVAPAIAPALVMPPELRFNPPVIEAPPEEIVRAPASVPPASGK